jgi:hypothetical protein
MDLNDTHQAATQPPSETLVVFLDANIVLEGKSLSDLPWAEVIADGSILALIVPKAMEEIDAKKRDGRLGPIARAFNRLIAPSVIQGKPVVIREAAPRVELAMAVCNRIKWDDYDELDPDDGDSRIVAEALNARDVSPDHRLLVSHDIKPLAYARGRQLQVHQASDAWLRAVEPGPKDKEIQRLKQQLSEFRKDEPTFAIKIEVSEADPLQVTKVTSLSEEQRKALTQQILARNKPTVQRRDPYGLSISMLYDHGYEERYEKYKTVTVPDFVNNFSKKMGVMINQRHLTVSVQNIGQIRADHLVIEVKTNDGWINERIVFVTAFGPSAPRPRSSLAAVYPGLRDLMPTRVGRHEFDFTTEAKRSRDFVTTCEDFRNGQEFCFDGVVVPTTKSGTLEISVKVTAANMRGAVTERLSKEKVIVEKNATTIADLETLKVTVDFPVRAAIDKIIEEEKYDILEWDRSADEDDD